MVYVDGAPFARSVQGTVFFHDFQPGTHQFTVQPYGTPANLVDTLQLAPGMQSYVQVQAVANWEMGSTAGGAVLTMSPQDAQSYLQTMTNLNQR
jgi:hypothetical protein